MLNDDAHCPELEATAWTTVLEGQTWEFLEIRVPLRGSLYEDENFGVSILAEFMEATTSLQVALTFFPLAGLAEQKWFLFDWVKKVAGRDCMGSAFTEQLRQAWF